MRSGLAVAAIAALGLLLAAGLGTAAHLVTKDTIALPATSLEAGTPLAPPEARETTRTVVQPPAAAKPKPQPAPTPAATTTQALPQTTTDDDDEDDDGKGRGRNRGRGGSDSSGSGSGGDDDPDD